MSSNPFLESVQALPPANPDEQNRAGAFQSTQIPADQFAKAKRDGAVLGLPATAAMTDPDLQRRAQTRRTLEAMRGAPPATRNFIGGPNGPLAQDDVENLSAAETAFRYFGEVGLRGAASGQYALTKGFYGLAAAVADIPAYAGMKLAEWEILPANPFAGPANFLHGAVASMDAAEQTYGVSAGQYKGVLDRSIANAVTSLHNNLLMLPVSAELNAPGTLLSQGSRLLGSESASLAPYAAARAQNQAMLQATRPTVFGTPLPETRSLLPIGAQTFGQSYADARQKNLSVGASLSYAAQQAGVEMVTEALPLGEYLGQARADSSLLKSFGKTLLEENVGEQVATAWQDLNEWLYLNPERTLQDYLNERPNAALETAISTTFATAVMSGSSHIAMHASRKQEAAIAEYHAQVLERLGKLTAATKLLERDPKSVEEILNHVVAEGGKVDTIYIDGQTLAQSGLAQPLAEASPSAREQIDQAVATGQSVAIPVAEYVASVATTPLGEQLLDHVRTHPDGMSRAEAKTFAEEAATTAEQETEKALDKAKVSAEFRKSQDAVRQRVLKELSGLGRFNQTTNNLYATLIAARSAARALQLGMTPEQFFDKQMLKTTSEGVTTGANAYNMARQSVTARTEELQAAAQKVKDGTMTREEYAALVDRYKPVLPYENVPEPATEEAMREALAATNREKTGQPTKDSYLNAHLGSLKEGDKVGLRLDIPSYTERNAWVVTVHGERKSQNSGGAGPRLGYASVAAATGVTFSVPERGAINIAAGASKSTIATMEGAWKPITPEEAKAQADAALTDPNWVQVGMDPERHGYFYDRATMQPVAAADEVIQIGPLVLARNVTYGAPEEYLYQSVSTRLPTAKKALENPLESMLVIGLEAAKMDAEAFAANMQVLRAYPNMVYLRRDETPEQIAERFIEHAVSNLLWLHDQVPADIRARSKLWYDGARAIVDRWQAKYPNLTDSQIAAVLAVLSPQKDWFMNVSLGERILDIMQNQRNFRWDDKMGEYVEIIRSTEEEAQRKIAEEEGVPFKAYAPTKYYEAISRIKGKTLQEVFDAGDDRDVAIWLRTYDQAYNTRNYRIVSPEGDFQDWVRNKPNKKQIDAGQPGDMGKVAWGSFGEIGKAVSVLRDGSIANISKRLGGQHKVRNFYNNIFNPKSLHGDVTIDTHAVAAALLQPLAGGSAEVKHNFGSGGVSNSSVYGAKGTYGIYAEAYRRAAIARGILPREMQSITWEAVRGLFQAEHKKRLAKPIRKIWNDYRQKRIDLNEARRRTVELAGAIVNPDWHGRPNTAGVGQAWASSYSHELAPVQLPDGGSGTDSGSPGGDAGRDSAAGGSGNAYRQGGLNGTDTGSPGSDQATTAAVRVPGGVRGSTELLDAAAGSQPNAGPLAGLPATVQVDGNPVTFGPMVAARAAAIAYCASAGIVYRPPNHYVKVDPARGRRIAAAYAEMQHDPDNPLVRASYEALAAETVAQYEAMLKTGIVIEFNPGTDPYGNPRNAVLDIVNNNHLYIFSTDDGYGQAGITAKDLAENPMLAWSDHMMGGRRARINDLFRAVHDFYGHAKEGIGFRAEGEENAWQQHMAMYSPKARPAATVELRGQNSWLNFGPHAEFNKTANGNNTIYAEQKIGLLPDWVVSEAWAGNGLLPPKIEIDGVMRATRDTFDLPLAPPMDLYQGGNNQLLTGVAGIRAFWDYYRDGPVDDQGRPVSFYRGMRREATAGELETKGRETLSLTADPGIADIYAHHQPAFKRARYGVGSGTMRYYINTQKTLDLRGNGETTSLWGFVDVLGNWNLEKQRGGKGEIGYMQIADAVMSMDDIQHSFGVDWSTSDYDTFTELADAFVEACEQEDYELAEALLSEVDVDIYALLDAEFGTLAAAAGYDSVYHDDPLTDEAVNLYTGNKDDLEYDENYDGRSTATLRPLSPDMVKAITNVGTYSRTTDPLYQSPPGGPVDHIFYSALLRATENAKIEKGNAGQWMGTLRNMPGVKPDEIKWLGLEEWLKEQTGIITRAQVTEFIRVNQVVFEESTSLPAKFVPPSTPFADAREEKQVNQRIAFELANGWNTKNLNFGPATKYAANGHTYYLTDVTPKNGTDSQGYGSAKGTTIWEEKNGSVEWVRFESGRVAAEYWITAEYRKGERDTNFAFVRIDDQGTNYREGVLRFPFRMAPQRNMTDEEKNMYNKRDSETLWKFASPGQYEAFLTTLRLIVKAPKGLESLYVSLYPDSDTVGIRDNSSYVDDFKLAATSAHARLVLAPTPQSLNDTSGIFTSGHFEHNVLTHMRWEDRQLTDGSTALYLMEVQSDWHQQGRERGYRVHASEAERANADPPDYVVLNLNDLLRQRVRSQLINENGLPETWDASLYAQEEALVKEAITASISGNGAARFLVRRKADLSTSIGGKTYSTEAEARLAAWRFYDTDRSKVPSAPFENTWHELAFKRMLHLAVSENYESLVWPGDAQHVADVEGWGPILTKTNDRGTQYVSADGTNYSAIINRYIQDLPRFANKYTAKWGGKVERARIPGNGSSDYEKLTSDRVLTTWVRVEDNGMDDQLTYTVYGLDENDIEVARFSYDDLKSLVSALGPTVATDVAKLIDAGKLAQDGDEAAIVMPDTPPEGRAVFRLKITPEMRESVLAGQALFQPQEQQPTPPRGEFIPSQNIINLLQNADLSTFLHESGHYFFENDIALAFELIQKPNLTDGERSLLNDVSTMLRWNGIQGELPEQLRTWNVMSFEERRVAHERTAESFEHYLFEGKAPSLELQPVFQRFRSFLLRVYRALKDFLLRNPEAGKLNDEVRAVFDRMLATEDQIALAQRARSMGPLFNSAEEAGMSPEEWQAYQAMQFDANDEAVQDLQARGLRDMTWLSNLKARTVKDISRAAAEKRKAVRAEVEAQVVQERVYAVQRWLRTGEFTMPGGAKIQATDGHKLATDLVASMYPAQALVPVNWRKLGTGKYGMLAKVGLAPDLVAQIFGYSSGDAMVRDILDAPPLRDRVEAETDRVMLERYGDLTDPKAISKAADEAIHNQVRLRFLATELAGLQKMVGQARVLAKMAQEEGARLAARTPIKRLATKGTVFMNAAARAGKASDAAFREGKTEEAARQKRLQMVNLAAAQEAFKAQRELAKAKTLFQRVLRGRQDDVAKQRNMDLVNTARAVLASYGMGKVAERANEYLALVQTYDQALYQALEPFVSQAEANRKPFEELTVEEMRALQATVESLWRLARQEKTVEIDGKRMERDDIATILGARLAALGIPVRVPGENGAPTPAEERARGMMGWRAALRRVESWVTRMDGGSITGSFRSFIFTPISEAADHYRVASGQYLRAYRDLLKSIEHTLVPGRIEAPELGGYVFGNSRGDAGMSELLHAVLHTGNDSNKQKLLLGRGWASERADGTLDTSRWDAFIERMIREGRLTAEHFDFAQGVWDLLDSTKPLAQRTHREVFGRYFDEVTANEVKNSLGVWRGGYVPALVDSFQVQDADINQQMEAANQANQFMFPATNKGFTKSRVKYNKPLLLDLRTLGAHLDKVLLFSHMEGRVRDVMRILNHPDVKGLLTRYDAVAYSDLLLPWLNRAARQTVETPATGYGGRAADKFFRWLRSKGGSATMFANVVNAFQQVTGFAISAVRVKPKYLRSAMVRHMRSPAETAEAVAQLSPFMATRLDNQTMEMRQEIESILLNPSLYEKTQQWSARHAYFLQSAFQNWVDVVTWMGAYDQAVDDGLDEKDAVRQANSTVRETQGSLNPEDVSRFEAGPAFVRLFTQFTSYFNMQANLLGTEFALIAQDTGLRKGAGKAFYVLLLGMLIPAWFSEIIVQAARGGPPDEDKDGTTWDDWLAALFGAPMRNVAAMTPVIGQATTMLMNSFNRKPYDDRLSTAPAVSTIESVVSTPSEVYKAIAQGKRPSRAIRDVLSTVAITTGIPVTPLAKPLGYWADIAHGNVRPTGLVDFARGTVTGVASPDSLQ